MKPESVDEEERREAESFRRFLEREKAKTETTTTKNDDDDDNEERT